jgi:hypothetical protein
MMPEAARELGYEPRPQAPHSLRRSAVTGDVPDERDGFGFYLSPARRQEKLCRRLRHGHFCAGANAPRRNVAAVTRRFAKRGVYSLTPKLPVSG